MLETSLVLLNLPWFFNYKAVINITSKHSRIEHIFQKESFAASKAVIEMSSSQRHDHTH